MERGGLYDIYSDHSQDTFSYNECVSTPTSSESHNRYVMDIDNKIAKLRELIDLSCNEDLIRSFFVQLSISLGEDRYKMLEVVFHLMDVMTWNFAADCMEVDVLGNKGINSNDDPRSNCYCFGRAGKAYIIGSDTSYTSTGKIKSSYLLIHIAGSDGPSERYIYNYV
jgi:hypothetical protein